MERTRFYFSGRDATKQGRPEAYINGVDLMLTFGRQVPLMMTANEEQKKPRTSLRWKSASRR
jgi:hypothetical protein